jgi:hypothetical protein
MTLVAVIAVLSRRLDVALALAAEFPRLAFDGFFPFFRCHSKLQIVIPTPTTTNARISMANAVKKKLRIKSSSSSSGFMLAPFLPVSIVKNLPHKGPCGFWWAI